MIARIVSNLNPEAGENPYGQVFQRKRRLETLCPACCMARNNLRFDDWTDLGAML
jgi:hypothetical protein